MTDWERIDDLENEVELLRILIKKAAEASQEAVGLMRQINRNTQSVLDQNARLMKMLEEK